MRLPDDLAQRIDEWFEKVYRAVFDEEVEWLVQRGQVDPGYDPEETTIEGLRQSVLEYIESEPEHFIEPLLEKCGTLERAIIGALLKRQGFVRVRKAAIPEYAWVMGKNPRREGQQTGHDPRHDKADRRCESETSVPQRDDASK